MRPTVLATVLFGLSAAPGLAAEPITWTVEEPVEDVLFAIENGIIGAGLVVEHRSYVGEMLARTKEDVGGTRDIFTSADVFTFCSAQYSRQVMEANPVNLQYCPYGIFVYEAPDNPGQVTVGFRDYDEPGMQVIEDLLAGIIKGALMVE